MKNKTISIFILIDALGWSYIKDRPFLADIVGIKRPVKSILGFSSGVIPSILTGKYPHEHKHWSLYYYSPKTSPFRWTKALLWLPEAILHSRITRKLIEEISKRLMGYTGYFETYLIPIEQLHLFDICEKANIYATKGIKEVESIFDIWQKNKVKFDSLSYPSKDKEILNLAKNEIKENGNNALFLYLSEFDALLHRACDNSDLVNKAIDYYENEIKELYRIAKDAYEEVNLFVFSDHGMAKVTQTTDLRTEIEGLGFEAPKDYVAFYDSTMARFWFFNPRAKDEIIKILQDNHKGKILEQDELVSFGINFENNLYGETIFLMDTGTVINPSYMGNKMPEGMHGFDINDSAMDAVLVSNVKVEQGIKDVKDLFKLMTGKLGDSPLRGQSLPNLSGQLPRVKVLYFLNSLVRGGVEEHVLGLLRGIDRDKFEPVLVCPQKLIDLIKDELMKAQVRYYPVCIRRWRNIGEIGKFIHILKKEKPDIVHSHLFYATMFAAPIAKLCGVKKIISTAHLREAWRKGIKKAYFVDRFFYRFVDEIIAVSYAVKDYLVEEKKIPESKITVIHNGVDVEKFKPISRPGLSNNHSFSQDRVLKFTIGVIGRLEPQKGHKYFFEALGMLNGKLEDVEIKILGDGSLRKELEDQSRSLNCGNRITFLGFRSDIVSQIQNLDLIVLPSLYEGLPLTALEAGAMGKPILATAVDGSAEVVLDGETGMLVPAADSAALKEAIEKILNDKKTLQEFGEKARKHIISNFDLLNQIRKTESLYLCS